MNPNPSQSTVNFFKTLGKKPTYLNKVGNGAGSGNKYGNTKTEKNGIVFDSKLESEFDTFFKNTSDIKLIDRQVSVNLVPTSHHPLTNETLKQVNYIADFLIKFNNIYYLVDSKGFRTADFQIKYKLMIQKYLLQECPLLIVCKSTKELAQILSNIPIIAS